MSHKRNLSSLTSCLVLVAVAGSLAAGCGEDGPGGSAGGGCDTIGARIAALSASAEALTELAGEIKVDVAEACAAIAGMDAPNTTPTDEQVRTLCQAARTAIEAEITGEVSITVVPPVCRVNAQAQLGCEAECQAEANLECDPGTIEARCEPGELSVQCEGTCEVGATCEGSATLEVACEGECSGVCEGTCSGTCKGECQGTCSAMNADGSCNGECDGTCEGTCEATCEGTCRGSCEITADAGIECSGEARCKGGCEGTATAPQCEATLEPPQCEGEASVDCTADCEASASLDAECTPAAIEIVGDVDATFAATLRAQLPVLITVAQRGEVAGTVVADLGADLTAVADDALSCTLQVGGSVITAFTAAAQASVEATASVSVSFEASASVSGSVGG